MPFNWSRIRARKFWTFPCCLKAFHWALTVSNPGSLPTAQALRNTFLVSHWAVSQNIAPHNNANMESTGNKSVIPCNTGLSINSTEESRTNYILSNEREINVLTKLYVNEMARFYNSFFKEIWPQGCSERNVSGQITYAMMTPPCLRFPVVFKIIQIEVHSNSVNLVISLCHTCPTNS